MMSRKHEWICIGFVSMPQVLFFLKTTREGGKYNQNQNQTMGNGERRWKNVNETVILTVAKKEWNGVHFVVRRM